MSNSETLFLYTTPKLFFHTFPIDTVFPGCRCISATNEPHELDLQQCVPFRKYSIEEMGIFRNVYIVKLLWHNTVAEFGLRGTNRAVSVIRPELSHGWSYDKPYLNMRNSVIPRVRAYVHGTSRTLLKEFCGTAGPEGILHIYRSIVPKGLSKLMRLHIPEVF